VACKKVEVVPTKPLPPPVHVIALKEYPNVTLTPPNPENTSKSFFAADSGKVFSIGNATTAKIQTRLNFGYYYLENGGISALASIDDFPVGVKDLTKWSKNRKTTIFKSTKLSYDSLKTISQLDTAYLNGDSIAAVGSGTAGKRVSNLAVGTTYLFKVITSSPKIPSIGVLRVKALTAGETSGSISFAVKYPQ